MAAAGGIDEDDVEIVGGCVGDGVFCDVGGVFAVAFFIDVDSSEGFAGGELF